MSIDPGERSRRITVQQATESINSRGERTATWADYATLWAKVEPLMGSAMFSADSEINESRMMFNVRYSSTTRAITPDGFRVVFRGTNYDIEAHPVDRNEAHEEILIRCVRRD